MKKIFTVAWVMILVVITSCSSTKKSKSTTSTSLDSVHVAKTDIKVATDSSGMKTTDSKTVWGSETIFEFEPDSSGDGGEIILNGPINPADYVDMGEAENKWVIGKPVVSGGKLKRIIHRSAGTTETKTNEVAAKKTEIQANTSDSGHKKLEQTVVKKEVEREPWWQGLIWWGIGLVVLIAVATVVWKNRMGIASRFTKIFKSKST